MAVHIVIGLLALSSVASAMRKSRQDQLDLTDMDAAVHSEDNQNRSDRAGDNGTWWGTDYYDIDGISVYSGRHYGDRLYQAPWKDWNSVKAKYLSETMYMCTQDSSVGHEFVVMGAPKDYSSTTCGGSGVKNCYERTNNQEHTAACAEGLGFRGGGGSSSSGSNGDGGVDCDDRMGDHTTMGLTNCYEWSGIKQQCSRRIAEQVASHFYSHRTYSIWAFGGTGSEGARLKQECTGWYQTVDAPTWLKEQEGKSALCWDLTIAFKAFYCYYKRTGRNSC